MSRIRKWLISKVKRNQPNKKFIDSLLAEAARSGMIQGADGTRITDPEKLRDYLMKPKMTGDEVKETLTKYLST